MPYPDTSSLKKLVDMIALYSQLKHERGSTGISPFLKNTERILRNTLRSVQRLPHNHTRSLAEPETLSAIRQLRPPGPRRIWQKVPGPEFHERLEGAFLGRCAGCVLGAPVELWPVERMENLARENGESFPPEDYWKQVPFPYETRYRRNTREEYTRNGMNGVPVDDDIIYTILGLLITERYGPDFTTAQAGNAWLDLLPYACTAEEQALENLRSGIPASKAADIDNPWCDWIGADIRADTWGYIAAGWPEKAAEMAYRDARLSHRRQGVYGAMYFAAVIAAAFTMTDPLDALHVGLTEIPRQCTLARAVRWALRTATKVTSYRDARMLVDDRFNGMHPVHTINNACLTIFGVLLGGKDLTRVIGETVAMGLDNDCTAATAGSICGAVTGRSGIPARWVRRFKNTVHSYINGRPRFTISGLVRRFERQARLLHRSSVSHG
jgi:ADP-ribosylglycohydrolase